MTKFPRIAVLALVVAVWALGSAGCRSGGRVDNSDHPQAEHPQGEHPKGDHPKH